MERVDTTDRLRRLREMMAEHKVDAYSMHSSKAITAMLTLTVPQSYRAKTHIRASTPRQTMRDERSSRVSLDLLAPL